MVTGCATQKRCSEKYPPAVIIHDSITTETVVDYRDTIIHIPGKYITVTEYIKDTVTLIDTVISKDNTHLSLLFHNGILTASCKADSLQMVISSLRSVLQKISRNNEKTIKIPVEVIKYRVPKWAWWLLGINTLLLLYKGYRWRYGL